MLQGDRHTWCCAKAPATLAYKLHVMPSNMLAGSALAVRSGHKQMARLANFENLHVCLCEQFV
jgi:hypothetical protein